MVEFAIAASVLVALLLGIVEFGIASWQRNSVASDARAGSRFAMVRGSASGRPASVAEIANFVKSQSSLDTIRVTATWCTNDTPSVCSPPSKYQGSIVSVHVEHDAPQLGPFIRARLDSSTSKLVILY